MLENRSITLLMATRLRSIKFSTMEYEYFSLNKYIIIFRSATVVSWILRLVLYLLILSFRDRRSSKEQTNVVICKRIIEYRVLCSIYLQLCYN